MNEVRYRMVAIIYFSYYSIDVYWCWCILLINIGVKMKYVKYFWYGELEDWALLLALFSVMCSLLGYIILPIIGWIWGLK